MAQHSRSARDRGPDRAATERIARRRDRTNESGDSVRPVHVERRLRAPDDDVSFGMIRMHTVSGILVLVSSCYQSHGPDRLAPTPPADAMVDSAPGAVDCGDEVYSRGECNACSRSTTWVRRCGSRAYSDGFYRVVFDLTACDRLTLVSCAVWQLETNTYTCVPPDACGDLDVSVFEDLLIGSPPNRGPGRFRPVSTDEEAPTCEEMIAAASDC